MNLSWRFDHAGIDWKEMSRLYEAAPLGLRSPEELKTVFSNSRFKSFVFDGPTLVGIGRALADGKDCSYLCDIAVLPDYQQMGLGKAIVNHLVRLSQGHRKIILYANPGKEGFYAKLGFKKMDTAMAIFENQADAMRKGVISD